MNTYRSFFRDFENLAKEFNQKIDEVIEIHERLELMAKQFNEWNAYEQFDKWSELNKEL